MLPPEHIPQLSIVAVPPQSPLQSKTLPSQSHSPSCIALQVGYVPQGVVGKSVAQSSHIVPSPSHTPHKSNSVVPPQVPLQSLIQSLEGSSSQYIEQSSKRLFTSQRIPQTSYAASPFIQDKDLINAYEISKNRSWNYVFAATSFSYPIQRAIKKLENGIKLMI